MYAKSYASFFSTGSLRSGYWWYFCQRFIKVIHGFFFNRKPQVRVLVIFLSKIYKGYTHIFFSTGSLRSGYWWYFCQRFIKVIHIFFFQQEASGQGIGDISVKDLWRLYTFYFFFQQEASGQGIGDEISVKDLSNDRHITIATVKDIYLFMGRELELMEGIPAGNVLG
jgi:hypothetical protein